MLQTSAIGCHPVPSFWLTLLRAGRLPFFWTVSAFAHSFLVLFQQQSTLLPLVSLFLPWNSQEMSKKVNLTAIKDNRSRYFI